MRLSREDLCEWSVNELCSFVNCQLCNVKETPQHTEEEVGAFTKLIEAMGFTGPLKYNKWVSGHSKQEGHGGGAKTGSGG